MNNAINKIGIKSEAIVCAQTALTNYKKIGHIRNVSEVQSQISEGLFSYKRRNSPNALHFY